MKENNVSEENKIIEENRSIEESLHSEDMQDIIGAPPRWLYKWGISIIMGVLLSCISMSFFISYPDVLHLNLRVKSLAPLTTVSYIDSGLLTKVYVNNEESVMKGQALAVLSKNNLTVIIRSPVSGKAIYAGIIHENVQLTPKQPIFYIVADNSNFYGEMVVTQNYLEKIKPGQKVLISFKNISKDEYINGIVRYVTEDTSRNSQHVAQIDFKSVNNKIAWLKDGLVADAGILTSKSTIFDRLVRSVLNRL